MRTWRTSPSGRQIRKFDENSSGLPSSRASIARRGGGHWSSGCTTSSQQRPMKRLGVDAGELAGSRVGVLDVARLAEISRMPMGAALAGCRKRTSLTVQRDRRRGGARCRRRASRLARSRKLDLLVVEGLGSAEQISRTPMTSPPTLEREHAARDAGPGRRRRPARRRRQVEGDVGHDLDLPRSDGDTDRAERHAIGRLGDGDVDEVRDVAGRRDRTTVRASSSSTKPTQASA